MPTSQALSNDDPRMIAWNKYKETEEYSNTKGWAGYAQHVEGSLWAAFLVGWTMAGHDSAGAANSPSPEVRQAWEEGRDEVCNMLVYAGAALDRGSPLKDCLASLVESGKAMQYPGPAAPPATKEGK